MTQNPLPKHYLITGSDPEDQVVFLKRLESHLANGFKLIQLRAKTLSLESYEKLAKAAIELGKQYQASILLNTEIALAKKLNAEGIHLTSRNLMELTERPLSKDKLVCAACHNTEQLKKAESLGVDFVTLSPVLPTQTHPDATPMGWETFSTLCHSTELPVFALGGLSKADLETAIGHGGYGIAAIRSLW